MTRTILNLAASPFLGGPERQMLGLGQHLPADYRSVFASFAERGLCRPFLAEVKKLGLQAIELRENAPRFQAAIRELAQVIRETRADIVCCHGYKPDLLGLPAARRAGVPVVSVSHGWTGCTMKVKVYETLDRMSLHLMDAVVCVSQGQAKKVRRAGVPRKKIMTIHNAIDVDHFTNFDPSYAEKLRGFFDKPPQLVIGGAGRLSPEKGFDQFIEAANLVREQMPDVGFVVFGEGPMRADLEKKMTAMQLEKSFILAGFRADIHQWIAALDVFVLSSFTEGLPVAVLEACAAGVPVVATAVGGTPEVISDGDSGLLVPSGNPAALARRIQEMARDADMRKRMGERGAERVRREFTFAVQAEGYCQLFDQLLRRAHTATNF